MKESIPQAPVPQESNEPKNQGRRGFLKKMGALGVATIAGSLLPEDAEAWGRQWRDEKVYNKEIAGASVSLVGFDIGNHELALLELFIKNTLPNATSIQFSFDEPSLHLGRQIGRQEHATQLYMHAILNDGSIVVCRGDLRYLSDDSGSLTEKIQNLFDNLQKGNAIQKKNGMERRYQVGNKN